MKTFIKSFTISGVGIHSGAPVSLQIKPSKTHGIFFKRTDIKGDKLIPATFDNVLDASKMNTTIGICPNCIQTIEHLMAALFICGIDSAIIEIDGPETPILDGSAKEFIEVFNKQKTKCTGKKKTIVIKREVIVYKREIIKKLPIIKRFVLWLHNLKMGRREDGFVRLSPSGRGLEIKATLDYPDKIIGRQFYKYLFDGFDNSKENFIKHIARSRTFGRHSEWEYLKKRGMGRGASEKNVIALNDSGDGTLNNLYYPDEFVRHKIIDALGDMYTSGGMIYGTLETFKGSHALNNMVLRKLFEDKKNYKIVMKNY